MYRLLVYLLKRFVIIVHGDMPAIYKSAGFSRPKHTERHSPLIFVYLVSVLVRVLLENAMGWPSYSSDVPRPYLLALVCIMTGFSQL